MSRFVSPATAPLPAPAPAAATHSAAMGPISVVVCTCNGARYLDTQMASLCAQRDVAEIVVVDDRSTDDTMAILQDYSRADPRVRLHWNSVRLGVVRNFERAVSLAAGAWIALADQDDIWIPDKIARLRGAWDGRSCLLHHASLKFRGDPPRHRQLHAGERRKYRGRDPRRLLYRNSIVGHATLVRADVARALMPFPADIAHDWWIGIGAALQGSVQYVDEYLVYYRIHDTNAYHPVGSRRQRLGGEHALRLRLLDHLIAGVRGPASFLAFARTYRTRLQNVHPGRFSPRLWHFHWTYAALLFGSPERPSSLLLRLRKSLTATLGVARATRTSIRLPQRSPARRALLGSAVGLGSTAVCAALLGLMPAAPRPANSPATAAIPHASAAIFPLVALRAEDRPPSSRFAAMVRNFSRRPFPGAVPFLRRGGSPGFAMIARRPPPLPPPPDRIADLIRPHPLPPSPIAGAGPSRFYGSVPLLRLAPPPPAPASPPPLLAMLPRRMARDGRDLRLVR